MTSSDDATDGKAHFDHIYDQPDPRAYYRTLGALDYEIPQLARPVLQALASAVPTGQDGPTRVLDVCCSYGINAALLRFDVSLDELQQRYAALEGLSPAELARSDSAFLAARRRPDAPRVSGLDVAANAVSYACRTGLLDDGWVEDLESTDPSPQLARELADVDLVTVTGGVGYVTEATFGRLLPLRADRPAPWVAAMVLRIYPYDAIAATLADLGLVTEKLHGVTFAQRRFADDAERDAAVEGVADRGLDPRGLEGDGRFHAELFVSRPVDDVARASLPELLGEVVPAG